MVSRDALVVDDDSDGREALAQALECDGYTVRQAENGRIAVAMICERVPTLLLLDLEMPVMDGWEVLRWTRGDPALGLMTVIVVSAAVASPSDVAVVRKPCQVDVLMSTIHRLAPQDAH